MGNPQLNDEQREKANELLEEIRTRMHELADGDEDLLFAYRRKVYKELNYDERGKPTKRRRLKQQLMRDGDGKCAECRTELPERGAVLDRVEAKLGYTKENVELICRRCDAQRQGSRGFT